MRISDWSSDVCSSDLSRLIDWINVRNAVNHFGLLGMEFVGANITKADNRAVLYHDRVEAILGIGAFRFRAPIPKMRPVHICIIDLSVADCLGACRVNKIRVFMNVREIITLHAARVMNDRDADGIEVPFFKDLTEYHAKRPQEHTSNIQ